MENLKPVFLLADSQLLFARDADGESLLYNLLHPYIGANTHAAYVGASNGDEPAFFELFCSAMETAGITHPHMISSAFNHHDREALTKSQIILLAGGDTAKGLTIFRETGADTLFQQRRQEGAVFIGISAGAVQLGWQTVEPGGEIQEALRFVPFIVQAHSNQDPGLLLRQSPLIKRLYSIPAGGGLIYHDDNTAEALKKPVLESIFKDEQLLQSYLLPMDPGAAKEQSIP